MSETPIVDAEASAFPKWSTAYHWGTNGTENDMGRFVTTQFARELELCALELAEALMYHQSQTRPINRTNAALAKWQALVERSGE